MMDREMNVICSGNNTNGTVYVLKGFPNSKSLMFTDTQEKNDIKFSNKHKLP
jgi:hypothetical protein